MTSKSRSRRSDSPDLSMTVRHTPFTAMDAPIGTSSPTTVVRTRKHGRIPVRFQRNDLAELLDDAGEHARYPSSAHTGRATIFTSGPTRVTLSISSVTASAKVVIPASPKRTRSGTEKLGGHVGNDLVDAARLDERSGERRAAFQQHVPYALIVQGFQGETRDRSIENQRSTLRCRALAPIAVPDAADPRPPATAGAEGAGQFRPARSSDGSSANTVPLPTRIASTTARNA